VSSGNGRLNYISRANASTLKHIIGRIEGRQKSGRPLNRNAANLVRARQRLSQLEPKRGGLFGAIGGIARGVGGAAIGGVKAAGGAAKYVAAGTVHHATQAARVAAPYVKLGVRYNGQKKAPPKKIPNTKIGNNRNRKAFNAGFGNEPWARQL